MAIKASPAVKQGVVERKKLKAEEWEEIRLGVVNPKTGQREGGLAHPEQNTAGGRGAGRHDWHYMVAALLGHVGKDFPPSFAKRHKEITAILAASTRRRSPETVGRGEWFRALVDLFEVAKAPEGAEDPTEDDIKDAGEFIQIGAERAARFNAKGEDAGDGKQKLPVPTGESAIDGLGHGETLPVV